MVPIKVTANIQSYRQPQPTNLIPSTHPSLLPPSPNNYLHKYYTDICAEGDSGAFIANFEQIDLLFPLLILNQ